MTLLPSYSRAEQAGGPQRAVGRRDEFEGRREEAEPGRAACTRSLPQPQHSPSYEIEWQARGECDRIRPALGYWKEMNVPGKSCRSRALTSCAGVIPRAPAMARI